MIQTPYTEPEDEKIEAYPVSDHARIGTLPRHFGRFMATVEGSIYDWMREFSADYQGGVWALYELSNGGFFMTPPDKTLKLSIASNGYQAEMTGEAAGITVCLFTFSHLSFRFPQAEVFVRHFHRLRDFAVRHKEADKIIAAID